MKAATVRLGHRLFTAGLLTLALTLTGAVLLVLDVAVDRSFAVPTAAGVGAVLLVMWFLVPLPLLRRAGGEPGDGAGPPPGDRARAAAAST